MSRILTRNIVLLCLLPLTLLVTAKANAESLTFSYTFTSDFFGLQPYAPGSKLFGQVEVTIDPMDPNRAFVNSFGTVSLSRPGFPLFTFPTIDNSEFNTFPPGNTPVMTFDGSEIDFRACPSGFTNSEVPPGTTPPFTDCPFALEGGFLVVSVFILDPALGAATAADGSDDAVCFPPPDQVRGCRVSELFPTGLPPIWSLALLPDGIDPTVVIDPTVFIGTGSTVDQDVVLEEFVVLGDNVSVDVSTSIGANTMIADFTVIDTNVEIGSDVVIGTNGVTDQNVVIQDGVVIGMNTNIDVGVHICSGVMIGSFVKIGKNNLVTADVPSTGELPDLEAPAPDCP